MNYDIRDGYIRGFIAKCAEAGIDAYTAGYIFKQAQQRPLPVWADPNANVGDIVAETRQRKIDAQTPALDAELSRIKSMGGDPSTPEIQLENPNPNVVVPPIQAPVRPNTPSDRGWSTTVDFGDGQGPITSTHTAGEPLPYDVDPNYVDDRTDEQLLPSELRGADGKIVNLAANSDVPVSALPKETLKPDVGDPLDTYAHSLGARDRALADQARLMNAVNAGKWSTLGNNALTGAGYGGGAGALAGLLGTALFGKRDKEGRKRWIRNALLAALGGAALGGGAGALMSDIPGANVPVPGPQA